GSCVAQAASTRLTTSAVRSRVERRISISPSEGGPGRPRPCAGPCHGAYVMSRLFCQEDPEVLRVETEALDAAPGRVRLARSPFFPGGGGQLADRGIIPSLRGGGGGPRRRGAAGGDVGE